jgi:hypothetical protein
MTGTTMPNSSAQPVNNFHSRTTIEGSSPTFGMLQQTTASMFGKGYTQTAPSFSIPNISSAPYTLGAMAEHTRMLAAATKPRTPP